MVLFTEEFEPSRSLRKRLRDGRFDVRINTACDEVIKACAAPRDQQAGTWITPDVHEAYAELHRQGYVQSVESWRNGTLVGGLYGVTLGKVFFGESMFALETDASKVALSHLVEHLHALDVPLIDCQQETEHLASLGARPISRARFAELLSELIHSTAPPSGWPHVTAAEVRP
jgi:leucyl/phenylalanyl-tRNA--protein transferase